MCVGWVGGRLKGREGLAVVGTTVSEERQGAKGGNRQHVKEQLLGCGCVPGRRRRNVNVDSVG